MKASSKRQDYCNYRWSRREWIVEVGRAVCLVGILAFFFYRSVWAVPPLAAVGAVYLRGRAVKKRDSRREELTLQFKECILSVAASLKAGYAVENAFLESRDDMKLLYGEDSDIYRELEGIRRGFILNITLEEQLTDLAERSGSEEVEQFAVVFSVARRSGGNLPEIIYESARLIGRRVDARQEMRTLLSGRRMEQSIMQLMPFGMLLYVGISYPGYFDVLYHNLQGIVVMTVCLGIYLAAYALGERILRGIDRKMA